MIPHPTIFSAILNIEDKKTALIFEDGVYTYGDIKNIHAKNSSALKGLQGKDIAILHTQENKLAILLSLLDGVVSSILLFADGVDTKKLTKHQVSLDEHDNVICSQECQKDINSKDFKQTQWLISTSGTTSSPKLISHTLESLSRTVKQSRAKEFILSLSFDIFRFSGLQVYLQAILTGSVLIIPKENQNMTQMLNFFSKHGCNSLSATPSFFKKALMSTAIDSLRLKSITLGGEITDKFLLKALKNKFPKTKIRHIYASTELGVGFCVNDEQAGFPIEYYRDGIDGIELKQDASGTLLIKSKRETQYINSGDLIDIQDDRVYFLGRDSGTINVGGDKIQPYEIESVLLESKLVSLVHVYAKKSSILGELICVDAVPSTSSDKKELKKKLFTYAKENLEKIKRPSMINIVDDIILTKNSKINRGN